MGSGRDGDAWPSVDIVQRIAVAHPQLYYEELRSMKCLASHRFWFKLGSFDHLVQQTVSTQELGRFEISTKFIYKN
eukprot:SAG11_NODE_22673_length_402_cov_0.762376_1_plen_76_part_00